MFLPRNRHNVLVWSIVELGEDTGSSQREPRVVL